MANDYRSVLAFVVGAFGGCAHKSFAHRHTSFLFSPSQPMILYIAYSLVGHYIALSRYPGLIVSGFFLCVFLASAPAGRVPVSALKANVFQ
jgi:hypothetical protein